MPERPPRRPSLANRTAAQRQTKPGPRAAPRGSPADLQRRLGNAGTQAVMAQRAVAATTSGSDCRPAKETKPPIASERAMRAPVESTPPLKPAQGERERPTLRRQPLPSRSNEPIQTKLVVGPPGDMYERDADHAANRAVAGQPVQRISRLADSSASPVQDQGVIGDDGAAKVQRRSQTLSPPLPTLPTKEMRRDADGSRESGLDVKSAAAAMHRAGGGAPLEPSMRARMEQSFGADFRAVRVHTDSAAQEASAALNARAFTRGRDIYLARGQSTDDRQLMAHELAHVVQQDHGAQRIQAMDVGAAENTVAHINSGRPPPNFSKSSGPRKTSSLANESRTPLSDIEALGGVSPMLRRQPQVPGSAFASGFRSPIVPIGSVVAQDGLVQRDENDDWDIFGSIKRRINTIVDSLRSSWNTVSDLATSAFSGLTSFLDSANEGLSGLVNSVVSSARASWLTAQEIVTQLTTGIWTQLGSWVSGVASAGAAIRDGIMRMDAAAIQAAWANLQGLVGAVWSQLQLAQTALIERVAGLWSGIESGFESAWDTAKSSFNALYEGLAEKVGALRQRIENAWEAVSARAAAIGGIAGEAVGIIQAAIERLMAWARSVWDDIRALWTGIQQRLDGLLSAARQRVNTFWETMTALASSAWEGFKSAWTDLEGWATAQLSSLMGGVSEVWQRVTSTSVGDVIGSIGKYSDLVKSAQQAVDNPDSVLEEVAAPVARQLQAGMPAEAERVGRENLAAAQAQTAIGPEASESPTLGTPVLQRQQEERSVTPPGALWEGFTTALSQKWAELKILELVKQVIITIVWPWPTVGCELTALWEDWTNAASGLFAIRNPLTDPIGALHDVWSNILALLDFPLALWRRINNIVLALMGWITIALMLLGAFGGAVGGTIIGAVAGAVSSFGIATAPGAAAGGGVGGFAGAGAGFGVALALGELFVISFALGEGASLLKMLVDLLTARQTEQQKTGDFNQAADSFIALGILTVLVALAWIGGRIAGAVTPLLKKVPLPRSLLTEGEKFAGGVRSTRPRSPPPSNMSGRLQLIRSNLHDPRAIEQFDQIFRRRGGDSPKTERIIEALNKSGNLEERLIRDWEAAHPTPRGEALAEVPSLKARAETLLAEIEAFRSANPQVSGIAKMLKALKGEIIRLDRMLNGSVEATSEGVQGTRNNINGIESEFQTTRSSAGVTGVNQKFSLDGRPDAVEVDVVADNGRTWIDSKRVEPFGLESSDWVGGTGKQGLKVQAAEMLRAAQQNPVNGAPPSVVFEFPLGVTSEVAAELGKMGITVRGNIVRSLNLHPLFPRSRLM